MEQELQLINEIFESDIDLDDVSKCVKDVLDWDSYTMLNFVIEAEYKCGKKISIEMISEVESIEDLIRLLQ